MPLNKGIEEARHRAKLICQTFFNTSSFYRSFKEHFKGNFRRSSQEPRVWSVEEINTRLKHGFVDKILPDISA